MRKVVKTLMANTGLFLISIAIFLVVGEFGIRFLELNTSARALMFSTETFRLDSNGAVRYLSNKNIRTVAVYNGEVEYDVDFHTNNLGLIDYEDYEYIANSNRTYYAFVGDSFTAGFHGGEPWVPKLRKDGKNNNTEIYNLGVSGTGIEHFGRLLKSVEDQLKITHIVVLAISNDFYRSFWYPLTNSLEIRFCGEDAQKTDCSDLPPIAKVIHPASSNEEILKVADEYIEERKNALTTSTRDLLNKSELFVFITRTIYSLRNDGDDANITAPLDSLRKIRDHFPLTEIHLIHLPEKQEVINKHYSIQHIGKNVEEMEIIYFPALKECEWSSHMFFVQDSHPNSLGYENIAKCVSSYLFSRDKGINP